MMPIFVFIALPTLSLALLLAILFRRFTTPALKPRMSQTSQGSTSPSRYQRAMSRLEALQLLGLDAKADRREIRSAHKRLMIQFHPDHGGTHQRAAELNEARDLLLQKKKSWAA